MATKSANVIARVEPEIKERAEAIFSQIGIPASTAINMFYRQVILQRGLPFRPGVSVQRPLSRDEMSDEEFNARMEEGYRQAKEGLFAPAKEVFARIRKDLGLPENENI